MRPFLPILVALGLLACNEYGLNGDKEAPTDTALPEDPPETREDTWDLTDAWGADVLFFGDTSDSMVEELQILGAQVETFVSGLSAFTGDWQLLAVTGPDGCGVGGVITPATPDYAATFAAAIMTPPSEDLVDEWGLYNATQALEQTDPGECNEGFLREGTTLSVIFISDEDDNSPGWDSGDPHYWRTYVDAMIARRGSADDLVLSAVAGPVPDGCATAEPGNGYADAVAATGGEFLSICDPWHEQLDVLVDAAVERALFVLSAVPVVETIAVAVDNHVRGSGWEYDENVNAVRFTADLPQSGQQVTIRYEVAP